jgi:hypothetical protein
MTNCMGQLNDKFRRDYHTCKHGPPTTKPRYIRLNYDTANRTSVICFSRCSCDVIHRVNENFAYEISAVIRYTEWATKM